MDYNRLAERVYRSSIIRNRIDFEISIDPYDNELSNTIQREIAKENPRLEELVIEGEFRSWEAEPSMNEPLSGDYEYEIYEIYGVTGRKKVKLSNNLLRKIKRDKGFEELLSDEWAYQSRHR